MEARLITTQNSLTGVLEFLKSNRLPYQDLELKNNLLFSYHDEEGGMIGSGGLEFYSSFALLRSVAVAEDKRGKSIGKDIVKHLLHTAKARGIREVYLLTETAHHFFLNRGFSDIPRENVPAEVKASTEFASVCPTSAAAMIYQLK
jgi:N-acetylglutamate synthase-like GNAT family acetyltransferase